VPTLNEGLLLARGEFIARMDADDVALSDRFEVQVAYLREHPEVVCLGSKVQCIDEAGRFLYEGFHVMDHEVIQELALTGSCHLSHPTVMMRRAAVMAVGGYDPQMKYVEDLDLFLRLGKFGRLVNLPRTVLKYRMHPSSICGTFILRQAEQIKLASDRACARRGIPPRYIERPPWRPANRLSRFEHAVRFGWTGYMRGDREMAQAYAAKAIRLIPWRSDGWRLLACIVLKLGRR